MIKILFIDKAGKLLARLLQMQKEARAFTTTEKPLTLFRLKKERQTGVTQKPIKRHRKSEKNTT